MGDCDYADGLWLCGRAVLQVDVLVLVIGKPASQCTPACVNSQGQVQLLSITAQAMCYCRRSRATTLCRDTQRPPVVLQR